MSYIVFICFIVRNKFDSLILSRIAVKNERNCLSIIWLNSEKVKKKLKLCADISGTVINPTPLLRSKVNTLLHKSWVQLLQASYCSKLFNHNIAKHGNKLTNISVPYSCAPLLFDRSTLQLQPSYPTGDIDTLQNSHVVMCYLHCVL